MQNLHGIVSLILFNTAVLAALVYLFFISTIAGLIYLVLISVAVPSVLFAYCAKCEARDQYCSHVIPGKTTRWLPSRKQGPYTVVDILSTAVSLAAIIIFPQFWLWQNKTLFLFFWALAIMATIEILLRVCPDCRNHNCVMCKKHDGKIDGNAGA